jgi:hypothetical protein
MSTYFKKVNLALVLMLVISLALPGTVNASPDHSNLFATSFGKKSPANGATIDLPSSTYYLLQWEDAKIASSDRYQYCIDESNNQKCDATWHTRDSLYSGPDFTVVQGHTYYWQVRTRDSGVEANGGTWWSFTVKSLIAEIGVYDDTDNRWIYSGTWTASKNTAAYKGTIHTTSTIGDYAEIKFNGAAFVLTFRTKTDRGLINVLVDGSKVATIDASSASALWQVTWRSPFFASGTHTVRFKHAGGGSFIDIDAIQIIGPPVQSGLYDDTSSNWIYHGAWAASANDLAYRKTIHTTSAVGASAEMVFNGTRFILVYRQKSDRGTINVTVDGQPAGTIVAQSNTPAWQATWVSDAYPVGMHTIRFEHGGNGTYIDIDAIQIIGTPVKSGIYDDTDSRWYYSGTWTGSINNSAYNKTIHTTSIAGSSAEMSFYGTHFRLTYRTKADRGTINVIVDGQPAGTIVAQSATAAWQVTWDSPTYTAGNHTVIFEHGGNGTYIDIDALQIIGP